MLADRKFGRGGTTWPASAWPFAKSRIPDDWLTFNARSLLGGSLLGQKKYAEAEPLLLSGYEGMKQREDKIPAAANRV